MTHIRLCCDKVANSTQPYAHTAFSWLKTVCMRKGGFHRWPQSPRGRYTLFVVLFAPQSVLQLTDATHVKDPRNPLAARSSLNGERQNTHISYEWSTLARPRIISDDHENHDGFRHLASNSLDHGRAPPRP
uniref:Uncharacterized protein n=1 Tax=Mesocestoides corti TaxID=53468 RepID=A0A5K3ENX9_MESCO